MKANLLNLRKFNSFSIIGLLSLFLVSCGSYQNSSYYDNDGIYGNNDRPQENYNNKYSEQNIEQSNQYASQFKNMQNEYEYFTDVENYTSNNQDTVVVVYDNDEYSKNYSGWGNNSSEVTINYYNNNLDGDGIIGTRLIGDTIHFMETLMLIQAGIWAGIWAGTHGMGLAGVGIHGMETDIMEDTILIMEDIMEIIMEMDITKEEITHTIVVEEAEVDIMEIAGDRVIAMEEETIIL